MSRRDALYLHVGKSFWLCSCLKSPFEARGPFLLLLISFDHTCLQSLYCILSIQGTPPPPTPHTPPTSACTDCYNTSTTHYHTSEVTSISVANNLMELWILSLFVTET